ncbi:TetR/AcrR family transcriptional regulator [Nocardia sp. NPDC057353]|uniref:TetR/AcrR family transcriptional regulator n=1 Tax=Nocardia sp. NPDC057353 TaxID=3346104 RepID=UPI003642B30D
MSEGKQGGRPRDEQVDRAIARAARELLAERGYTGFTVDAVAARAGVGKAAIYRRFPTKQELIYTVAIHGANGEPPADRGSLAADLTAVCRTLAEQLAAAPPGVYTGLLADLYGSSGLATRFSEVFLARQRAVLEEVLGRAVARGELAAAPDPLVLHALVVGPLFVWLFVLGGAPEEVRKLVDTVVAGVLAVLR